MATSNLPLRNTEHGYTLVTHVLNPSNVPNIAGQNNTSPVNPGAKFLKAEPKVLGTIQIMIGLLTLLFGIVMTSGSYRPSIVIYSGITYWGSVFYIISGSLTVAAAKNPNKCLVNGSLVMNIFSSITAGIAMILISMHFAFWSPYRCYGYDCWHDNMAVSQNSGIHGVLLVFAILQFFITVITSAFACKSTCTPDSTVSIITVLPNSEGVSTLISPVSAQYIPTAVGNNAVGGIAMSSAPLENPPPYSELKVQPDTLG